jgi:hypothetical protein
MTGVHQAIINRENIRKRNRLRLRPGHTLEGERPEAGETPRPGPHPLRELAPGRCDHEDRPGEYGGRGSPAPLHEVRDQRRRTSPPPVEATGGSAPSLRASAGGGRLGDQHLARLLVTPPARRSLGDQGGHRQRRPCTPARSASSRSAVISVGAGEPPGIINGRQASHPQPPPAPARHSRRRLSGPQRSHEDDPGRPAPTDLGPPCATTASRQHRGLMGNSSHAENSTGGGPAGSCRCPGRGWTYAAFVLGPRPADKTFGNRRNRADGFVGPIPYHHCTQAPSSQLSSRRRYSSWASRTRFRAS